MHLIFLRPPRIASTRRGMSGVGTRRGMSGASTRRGMSGVGTRLSRSNWRLDKNVSLARVHAQRSNNVNL